MRIVDGYRVQFIFVCVCVRVVVWSHAATIFHWLKKLVNPASYHGRTGHRQVLVTFILANVDFGALLLCQESKHLSPSTSECLKRHGLTYTLSEVASMLVLDDCMYNSGVNI